MQYNFFIKIANNNGIFNEYQENSQIFIYLDLEKDK